MNDRLSNDVYDVIVVGGGPAGSSGAYHAAQNGLKTILIEKKKLPRDKPCGGALSERALDYLGKQALDSINCKVKQLALFSPSLDSFVYQGEPGYFIVREVFDTAMVRDAEAQGAEVVEEAKVVDISTNGSNRYQVTIEKGEEKKTIESKYVFLATGVQNNPLIKKLGIRKRWPEGHLAMCVVSETPVESNILDSHEIYSDTTLAIYFGIVPKGYGWYFVKDGYINIGIGATWLDIKDKGAKNVYNEFVQLLKKQKHLPEDIKLTRSKSHTLVFKKTAKTIIKDNILLLGDAAGFVSPVSGEGIYYSVKSGYLAAKTVKKILDNGGKIEPYEKEIYKDFGKDLNRSGLFLQKTLYSHQKTMELAVKLGKHDDKMAKLITRMVYGITSYRTFVWRALIRAPISLIKLLFKRGEKKKGKGKGKEKKE